MQLTKTAAIICLLLITATSKSQEIPTTKVINNNKLIRYLKKEVVTKNNIESEKELAKYYRNKFSERFYYDWQNIDDRFTLYQKTYNNQSHHEINAQDHMQKFADTTPWLLPFNYQNGEQVNAYALRHLARQHKMIDVALMNFYKPNDPKYIHYFTKQMQSLNEALKQNKYEKIEDGNGVFEAFRSGYRVLNWLTIHNIFLGQDEYTDDNQLTTIATLLQHGAHLYKSNEKFKAGNHQTRGMSALAMLSILLRDFEGTDIWFNRAMKRLEEHITKEINADSFQFERSVHYHMSDIENYFFVYQLAKISNIEVSAVWQNKLKSLFNTLVKIAYPDKSAPVLQDDTDNPWAEKNNISGALTLGYLLFEDPQLGYFANKKVEDRLYWFIQDQQLKSLESIHTKKPEYGSLVFPDTKYFIMRQGWNNLDKMMIISAGLDSEKPDHQHGDMLGIQAMANGQVILPNYQVRYSLPDYDFFKNSMVKNVALVDDEVQGKKWKGNSGGSGFGKFMQLPNPKVLAWKSNNEFDFFAGSHDGFEDIGVFYSRQVIYIKDDFWIVKDNFHSENTHNYKQVWQGHYTLEKPHLIRSTFNDGSACDILQLSEVNHSINDGTRGKEWTQVNKTNAKDFSFITVIYPYKGYNNRIDENNKNPKLKEWKTNTLIYPAEGKNISSLTKGNDSYLFNVEKVSIKGIELAFTEMADVYISLKNDKAYIHSLSQQNIQVDIKGTRMVLLDNKKIGLNTTLAPGSILEFQLNK